MTVSPHFFSSVFLAAPPLTMGLLATWSLWSLLRASFLVLSLTLDNPLTTFPILLIPLLSSTTEEPSLLWELFFFLLILLWLLCFWRRVMTLLDPFFAFSFLPWRPTDCSLELPEAEALCKLVKLRGSVENC